MLAAFVIVALVVFFARWQLSMLLAHMYVKACGLEPEHRSRRARNSVPA